MGEKKIFKGHYVEHNTIKILSSFFIIEYLVSTYFPIVKVGEEMRIRKIIFNQLSFGIKLIQRGNQKMIFEEIKKK